MSDDFVNRVTLDCLLNKEMYSNQIKTKTFFISISAYSIAPKFLIIIFCI